MTQHQHPEIYIHDSAHVDTGASIGHGTKIWHGAHVMSTAIIGNDCVLGQNVFVGQHVSIGNKVKLQNNINVYDGVIIEDEVFLGPSMTFTNVINPRSAIERKESFQQTMIRKGASIGANACLICGIEIGEYAFIGAASVVTQDVKPYQLVVGNPARPIGWMSRRGIRLSFNADGIAICPESNEKYVLRNAGLELLL